MPKLLMIDEFHLSVWVPRGQPAATDAAIRATLDSRRLQADLRRAFQGVMQHYPSLSTVRVRLTR